MSDRLSVWLKLAQTNVRGGCGFGQSSAHRIKGKMEDGVKTGTGSKTGGFSI
jgi:hypothetical protein